MSGSKPDLYARIGNINPAVSPVPTVTPERAKEMMDAFYARHPKIEQYIRDVRQRVTEINARQSVFGRRRRIHIRKREDGALVLTDWAGPPPVPAGVVPSSIGLDSDESTCI